jgi:Tol biopolymer transport system component
MRIPALPFRTAFPLVAAFFVIPPHVVADVAPAPVSPALAEPSPSPDHREIAFVSGGDIWTVPFGGGEARLLVSHPATESRPIYSPDGSQLAFVSNRTGNGDVYLLTLTTGDT